MLLSFAVRYKSIHFSACLLSTAEECHELLRVVTAETVKLREKGLKVVRLAGRLHYREKGCIHFIGSIS